MNILLISQEHPLWEKTAEFAQNCSWKAGQFLAEKMRKNDFTVAQIRHPFGFPFKGNKPIVVDG